MNDNLVGKIESVRNELTTKIDTLSTQIALHYLKNQSKTVAIDIVTVDTKGKSWISQTKKRSWKGLNLFNV